MHHMVVAVCDGGQNRKTPLGWPTQMARSHRCGLVDWKITTGLPWRQMTLVCAWSKNAGRFETGSLGRVLSGGKTRRLGASVALGRLLRQPTEEKDRGESAAISIETDPRMPQSLLSCSSSWAPTSSASRAAKGEGEVAVRPRERHHRGVFAYRVHAHGLGRNIALRRGGGHGVPLRAKWGPGLRTTSPRPPTCLTSSRAARPCPRTRVEPPANVTRHGQAPCFRVRCMEQMCNLCLLLRSHV